MPLSDEQQNEMYAMMRQDDFGDEMMFRIEKKVVQEGRTISADAMEDTLQAMAIYVGARVMAAWEKRQEPPTLVTITVKVEAS